jgi:hypothetical protein
VGVVQRRKEETIQELSSGWTVFLSSFGLVQQFGVFMLQEMAFQNITFLPLGGGENEMAGMMFPKESSTKHWLFDNILV